ncbi:MAG: hypothetical protein ACJ77A_14155 [Actinomycetota bacterium]
MEAAWLRTLCVLFFIELSSRLHLARDTAHPDSSNPSMGHSAGRSLAIAGHLDNVRYLVQDRDSKFTRSFDDVFRTQGATVIRTPIRAPRANDMGPPLLEADEVPEVRARLLGAAGRLEVRQVELLERQAPLPGRSVHGHLIASVEGQELGNAGHAGRRFTSGSSCHTVITTEADRSETRHGAGG